jgi:hypothetical protein
LWIGASLFRRRKFVSSLGRLSQGGWRIFVLFCTSAVAQTRGDDEADDAEHGADDHQEQGSHGAPGEGRRCSAIRAARRLGAAPRHGIARIPGYFVSRQACDPSQPGRYGYRLPPLQ